MNHDVWVFVETKNDGSAKNVSIELLQPARTLAEKQGGELVAVVLGANPAAAVEEACTHDADKIILLEGNEYTPYSTDAYASAFCYLIEKYEPKTVILGATVNGRDLAPRVATRIETGLTADCTELDFDEETGNVLWTRPTFGGNLMACIMCPDHRPQMGTVRAGVFKKSEETASHAEIIREDFHVDAENIRVKILETISEIDGEDVDLEGADIIVSGGAGLGGKEGFDLLRELAKELGGVIAASRMAVDNGWISHAYQVGQTGKVVTPKLYIACGISGKIQHRVGMSSAETIVAINADPEAPIFEIADYGIVGDYKVVIPAMLEELREMKSIT